jgi:glucokinase
VGAAGGGQPRRDARGDHRRGDHERDGERDHLAYIYVGAGIVAGFVTDGELYVGAGGSAGELGHTTILPDGPACACGNRGCLHMLASESAILREVRTKARQRPEGEAPGGLPMQALGALTIERLRQASQSGDPVVLDVLREAGRWVGIALANVINLMNPSLVVIGGSIAEFGDPFLDSVRAEVRQRALWDALHGVTIVPSTLGDSAGTIGGAALFLDSLDVARVLA